MIRFGHPCLHSMDVYIQSFALGCVQGLGYLHMHLESMWLASMHMSRLDMFP